MRRVEVGDGLRQLAGAANLGLAVSILALTIARQSGSARPAYTRSWIFFGLAAVTLLARAAFDLAGPTMEDWSRIADVATTGLLSVAFIFLYGADREGINKLQEAAERDGLTNLYDLRAFTQLASDHLERAAENGGRCAVAIMDVDGFKSLNDTLGHQAGDRMLQLVASAIRANVRPGDVAGRYGGDEFIILLDRCDTDEAKRVCSRVLRSVVMLSLAAGRQVTLSIGISVSPDNGTDLRDLIANADRQLLAVKRSGKNAVSVAAAS